MSLMHSSGIVRIGCNPDFILSNLLNKDIVHKVLSIFRDNLSGLFLNFNSSLFYCLLYGV